MSHVYVYKVRDQMGKLHQGEIEAESRDLVVERLRQSGYFVTKVEPKTSSPTVGETFAKFSAVTPKDLSIFFRQFSTMISAGLPLLKCLNILVDQTEKKTIRDSLEDIRKEVESGNSLSQAMGKHNLVFPGFVTAMIRAGEAGGVLDDVMKRLAKHFEDEHEIREKIKTAVRYPIIVLCFALLVVVLMITFIIPNFATMFENMEIVMPLPTRIILGISDFMQSFWLIMLLFTLVILFSGIRYFRTAEGRKVFDKLILKTPVFGALALKSSLAKTSRSLGTLLSSGVPIIQALEITQGIAGNSEVARDLELASQSIRDGSSISSNLSKSKVFTPMMVNMIAVGEETGNLEQMLSRVADFYDSETKYMTEHLTSLIEPFLIVFLGVVIGGILISILLPIFEIYSQMGAGI